MNAKRTLVIAIIVFIIIFGLNGAGMLDGVKAQLGLT